MEKRKKTQKQTSVTRKAVNIGSPKVEPINTSNS